MLEIRNLTKAYGQHTVVKSTNLEISTGEFFCLLGPSGCGKATILRMIAGFEKASSGTILFDGIDITSSIIQSNSLSVLTGMLKTLTLDGMNVFLKNQIIRYNPIDLFEFRLSAINK